MELDERVHTAIYAWARNDLLAETLRKFYILAHRIWHLALDRAENLEDAVQQHDALLEAIGDGDGERAANLVRIHIDEFELVMKRVLVTV